MTDFDSIAMPRIPTMTREEKVEELVAGQRKAIEDMTDHDLDHHLVRTRSNAYLSSLMAEVHVEGNGEGSPTGFLADDSGGQYL